MRTLTQSHDQLSTAGDGRARSEVSEAGFDMQSERDHGPNRINLFFDPAMTDYWRRRNGGLILHVSRIGICVALPATVLGFVAMIAL